MKFKITKVQEFMKFKIRKVEEFMKSKRQECFRSLPHDRQRPPRRAIIHLKHHSFLWTYVLKVTNGFFADLSSKTVSASIPLRQERSGFW
jgi:hypothetical protein